MTELKTSEHLLQVLQRASSQGPTAAEVHCQRISFIMGSLREDSSITRARVEEVLAHQEGRGVR